MPLANGATGTLDAVLALACGRVRYVIVTRGQYLKMCNMTQEVESTLHWRSSQQRMVALMLFCDKGFCN